MLALVMIVWKAEAAASGPRSATDVRPIGAGRRRVRRRAVPREIAARQPHRSCLWERLSECPAKEDVLISESTSAPPRWRSTPRSRCSLFITGVATIACAPKRFPGRHGALDDRHANAARPGPTAGWCRCWRKSDTRAHSIRSALSGDGTISGGRADPRRSGGFRVITLQAGELTKGRDVVGGRSAFSREHVELTLLGLARRRSLVFSITLLGGCVTAEGCGGVSGDGATTWRTSKCGLSGVDGAFGSAGERAVNGEPRS